MTEEELQIFDELNHPPGKYVFFSSTQETKFITNIKDFFYFLQIFRSQTGIEADTGARTWVLD